MSDIGRPDWDPRSREVLRDQRAAYDAMRDRCPVAHSEFLGWSLFRHEDVLRVLQDHDTFSSAVSRHLSVPNGMDPPEHTDYRRVIEPYFAPDRIGAFEPTCRRIAAELVHGAGARGRVELMSAVALPFAARAQCAFLGWSPASHEVLVRWTQSNHQATLARDRQAAAKVAREFEDLINEALEARRRDDAGPGEDLTARLMHEVVDGRPLDDREIASILRNWTVGEVGTLAASVGILAVYLAQNPALAGRLREDCELLPAAIDEILRIHGPLVSNRRVATRAVEIGGRTIQAGERLSLIWVSANRDDRVFDEPDKFDPPRNAENNLLYGAGIHVCPGAPLARMELRVIVRELLDQAGDIRLDEERAPQNAVYPASGFASLPMYLR